MSLVVGDYSEMDHGGQEDIDKFNDETFGSGTEGKRSHFFASPLLAWAHTRCTGKHVLFSCR